MTDTDPTTELSSKFYHAVRILEQFDCAEVRGVAKGQLSLTERETCVFGLYYRAALNARSLVVLNDPVHFQAITQIARALLELGVDLRLLDVVPDAVAKIMAYSGWEKLRAAREVIEFAETPDTDEPGDLDIFRQFLEENEVKIRARREELWPDVKRLDHWSGMDLRTRVSDIRLPYHELHRLNYRRLSWYAHAGLTGVFNLEKEAFVAVAATSLQIAAESYSDILAAIIAELQLERVDPKINDKLNYARMLAFAGSPEEADVLRRELLE
ncbi:MAG: DUF5677 domain-containing protein [Acidobacteriota bacterium]